MNAPTQWQLGFNAGRDEGHREGRVTGYRDGVNEGIVQGKHKMLTQLDLAESAARFKGFLKGLAIGFALGAGFVLMIFVGSLS